jgi:hypothetical protein
VSCGSPLVVVVDDDDGDDDDDDDDIDDDDVAASAVLCALLLCPSGQVVYTSGNLMRVTVVATKHQQLLEKPSELHASVTNDFTFVLAGESALT